MAGWIKLYRKITENPIFNDHQLFRLWVICLTEATHKKHQQLVGRQMVDLEPGEFVTGRFHIHDLYNRGLKPKERVSEKTLWRWLQSLEKYDFLTIKVTNKFSIVHITKWTEYQISDQENDQQVTNKCPSNDQQMTTNKNVKNVKNEKNGKNGKKKTYAEFVTMTTAEYEKLVDQYGESNTQKMITVLDNYKGSNGKRYKSDYRAILNWVADKVKGGANHEATKRYDARNPRSGSTHTISDDELNELLGKSVSMPEVPGHGNLN
jgi:hypothetical protein